MSSPNPAEKSMSSPYVGPRPFEHNEEDRSHFFGRTQETQEIVSLIFGHPLTLVYAQSGAGKTSLFNASIIPTLEDEAFDVLPLTRVRGVMPEGVFLENIQNLYIFNALLNLEPDADPQSLITTSLKEFLNARHRPTKEDGRPVPQAIIFDQFEELFTFSPEDWQEQREGFFIQVMDAINADPLLRVVFIIREDLLAQLDPYARSLSERLRARYRLERLQEDAALRAIKAPLVTTSRSYAPGVAENLVKELLITRTVDALGEMIEIVGQYVEPVQLQVVCLTLWSGLPPECTVITQEHLKDFNVNTALSDFYETAVRSAALDAAVQETALREWFGQTLITPMETRSTVYRGEKTTGGIPNRAVDILESRHLIRAEYRAGVRWYELTHDRFIEAIVANNKDWQAKRRGTSRNPLTKRAGDWNRLGRDDASLLRGALLEEANEWFQSNPSQVDELERAFLKASQANQLREKFSARTAQTRRALTFGLAIALIVAAIAFWTALVQWDEAEKSRAQAEATAVVARKAEEEAKIANAAARSAQFARQAVNSLKSDPQLSLLLAIEANRVQHSLEADDAIRQAIEASRVKAILRQQNRANALAFSTDGRYLVTGDSGGNISLWDIVAGNRLPIWEGFANSVAVLAFNPDGKNFVTGSSDGSVILWDLNSVLNEDPDAFGLTMQGSTAAITSLAFSRQGDLLAVGSADGTCLVWATGHEEPLHVLKGHTGQINAIAFSPAGDRIVTASLDSTGILWDSKTGLQLATLGGHASSINAAVFSPDGQMIVTASSDGTIRLWHATNGEAWTVLESQSASVTRVIFDNSGRFLATVSADNTVRIWEVSTDDSDSGGALVATLSGHEAQINSATFSPDGALLATGSVDGTARLWKVPTGELQAVLGHTSSVNIVAFNPKGDLLATASSDGTVRLWDVTNPETQKTLRSHEGEIYDIAIDRNGRFLASKGKDATTFWDLNTVLGSESNNLSGTVVDGPGTGYGLDVYTYEKPQPSEILLATSTPDAETQSTGIFLATSSVDEKTQSSRVRIWDLSKPNEEDAVASHNFPGELVENLAFRPEQNLLVISTYNPDFGTSNLILWSFSNKAAEDIMLSADSGEIIYGIAFSRDGSLLAASSANTENGTGAIHFWYVEDLIARRRIKEIATIRTQGSPNQVAFSPDGNVLASGSFDGTITLWDVAAPIQNDSDIVKKAVLNAHEGATTGLAFRSGPSRYLLEESWLASAGEDGNIHIWDVAKAINTGGRDAEISILRGQGRAVNGVAFTTDGKWLVSGGEDQLIRLWLLNIEDLIDLACSRATRNFTQAEWVTYFGRDEEYRRTCETLPYHPSALEAMIEQGKELARQDRVNEARSIWQKVNELDTHSQVDPDALLAEVLVERGQDYASAGDADKALEALHQAKDLNPSLAIDPEAIVAEKLEEQGRQYAASGDPDKGLETLRQADEIDPTRGIDPEAIVLEMMVEAASQYASEGEYTKSLEALQLMLNLDLHLVPSQATIVQEWISMLGDSRNPFENTPDPLEQLRQGS